MAKIALIHGYGTLIDNVYKRKDLESFGFKGFRPLLKSGDANVFQWATDTSTYSGLEAINPLVFFTEYESDLKKILDDDLHKELHIFLESEQPSVISTHSLGTTLLLTYLKKYSLPSSVKHIISQQADTPSGTWPNLTIASQLKNQTITWTNYYCWWDISLWYAALRHGSKIAGLSGFPHPHVKNTFAPLTQFPSVHTTHSHSESFAQKLFELALNQ